MSVITKLGIGRMINARGTASAIGTSALSAGVQEAMCEAASAFISMDQMQEKAGAFIAEVTRTEGAVVTPGAAAGITLAIGACIVGSNRYAARQLPNTLGLKNEVIIQRGHRNDYDQAALLAGAAFVEVGYIFKTEAFELEAAINDRTAAVLFVDHMRGAQAGMLRLPEVVRISHAKGVPVVVDAATKLPPYENLWEIPATGADLVIFSGGKAIQGPGASGFVCGRKDLIAAVQKMVAPNWGIGRPMKIGKEEVAGLVAALDEYIQKDHAAVYQTWENRVEKVLRRVSDIPGYKVERMHPDECSRPIPRARITALTHPEPVALEIIQGMKEGNPAIAVAEYLYDLGVVMIDPTCLKDGEEEVVADRLFECMQKAMLHRIERGEGVR